MCLNVLLTLTQTISVEYLCGFKRLLLWTQIVYVATVLFFEVIKWERDAMNGGLVNGF